jgi:FdhE protein
VSDTTEALAELDRYVARLVRDRPELEAELALDAAIAREALSSEREPRVRPIELSRARLVDRVRHGRSLLHLAPVVVDVRHAADLFSRLVGVAYEHGDDATREQLETLVVAATTGRVDADQLFTEAFVQHREHVWEIAGAGEVDGDLLGLLAGQAVMPLLRAYAVHLAPMLERIEDGAAWSEGYCPICGARPLVAERRGPEGQRCLRCGTCGTSWTMPRLACVFCQDEDLREITLRSGDPRYGLEVCDRCKGYLKMIATPEPIPAVFLALEDVASSHLDELAMGRGYYRPSGNGYFVDLADFDTDDEVGIEEAGAHR